MHTHFISIYGCNVRDLRTKTTSYRTYQTALLPISFLDYHSLANTKKQGFDLIAIFKILPKA